MASTGKRYSEEQIVGILKQADSAGNVGEVIRVAGTQRFPGSSSS